MQSSMRKLAQLALLECTITTGGCLVAAAGAGAGAAVYATERGAESVVTAPVSRTFDAAQVAFQAFAISETKTTNEQDGATEKRSLEGKTADREVEVDLKSLGSGTHVDVVVKKTAVTWDKDFARRILSKIVEQAK